MRSKARALVWEYFAFGWRPILLALMGMLVVPLFAYGLYYLAGRSHSTAHTIPRALPGDSDSWDTLPVTSLHVNLMIVGLLFACFATLYAMETRRRLHVLPISPWFWLACKLPVAMGTAVASYLITAGTVNLLFQADWPLLGPSLFFAATVSVIHMALSLTTSMLPRVVLCSGAAALLNYWLRDHYVASIGIVTRWQMMFEPGVMWTELTAADLFTLSALATSGYVISALAMEKERHGERLILWKSPLVWVQPDSATRRFRSPSSAQFWMEWREKGLTLPLCIGVLLLCLLAASSMSAGGLFSDLYQASRFAIVLFALLAPLVVGLGMGGLNTARLGRPMGSFRATRPATDAQLSGAALRVAAASLLLASLIVGVYWLGLLCWLSSTGRIEEVYVNIGATGGTLFGPRSNIILAPWFVLTPIVIVWTATGILASLALSGRWRWAVWAVGGALAWSSLYAVSQHLSPEYEAIVQFACSTTLYVIGLGCLPATAWAFRIALQKSIVERETAWIAFGLWIAALFFWLSLNLMFEQLYPWGLMLIACLSALPIAPLATAPLAVAWNRHR